MCCRPGQRGGQAEPCGGGGWLRPPLVWGRSKIGRVCVWGGRGQLSLMATGPCGEVPGPALEEGLNLDPQSSGWVWGCLVGFG